MPGCVWGELGADIDQGTLDQFNRARQLVPAVAAALMPDAHVGYGLPIGGVLATRGAVVPYAVGVDIACRMRLSVLDLPADDLGRPGVRQHLARAIEASTRFGVGASFDRPHEHEVMDDDWDASPATRSNRDRAAAQLGTSGSGNHFVEFGVLTVLPAPAGASFETARDAGFGSGWAFDLAPGRYAALLSHSGSRGVGAAVCTHYSNLAMAMHPELEGEVRRLAWLDLGHDAGREYWHTMNLMGRYASANHAIIHREVAAHAGAGVLAYVENHHNFAWEEDVPIDTPAGPRVERLIVHRKGATPASPGVLGVIPGSMGTPGFVVVGLGGAGSLNSASHGAGRVMSRTQARKVFRSGSVRESLAAQGITVLSAGADESPGVYKDIHRVMALQRDLVAPIARFDPVIVKMAPEGERAED